MCEYRRCGPPKTGLRQFTELREEQNKVLALRAQVHEQQVSNKKKRTKIRKEDTKEEDQHLGMAQYTFVLWPVSRFGKSGRAPRAAPQ